MKSTIVTIVCIAFFLTCNVSIAVATDPKPIAIEKLDWAQAKERGQLRSGEVIPGDADQPSRLKIINTQPGTHSIPLCEFVSPQITTPSYAVQGKIRYDGVVGVGFLEMWNHFEGQGEYFTRTMDTLGPMRMITGTSSDRDFLLPFHTLGQAPPPTKLVVNLVLNGPGTVEIGPLELVPITNFAAADSTGWWSSATGGMIGGVGGTLLGLLGGLIGLLVGRGRAPNVVFTLAGLISGAGAVLFCGGVYAIITSQPFPVTYPLLLLGGFMSVFGTSVLYFAPAKFREFELRRMQALDLK